MAKSLSPGLYRSSCSCLPDSFTVNFGRFPELFMQQSAPARIYQLTPRAFWDRVTHTQYDFFYREVLLRSRRAGTGGTEGRSGTRSVQGRVETSHGRVSSTTTRFLESFF